MLPPTCLESNTASYTQFIYKCSEKYSTIHDDIENLNTSLQKGSANCGPKAYHLFL